MQFKKNRNFTFCIKLLLSDLPQTMTLSDLYLIFVMQKCVVLRRFSWQMNNAKLLLFVATDVADCSQASVCKMAFESLTI